MFKHAFRSFCASGLLLAAATHLEAAILKVEDIRVEGLQRIDEGALLNALPITVGEFWDTENATSAIRAVFKTGFFKDVELAIDGSTLVVSVAERPSIAEITFSGNEQIEDEQLDDSLSAIGLIEGRVYDRTSL